MRVPNASLRERIAVEDAAGNGARGPLHGAARTIRAAVQPSSKLITNSRGVEVVADFLAIIRPEAGPVPPESVVTWAGRRYRVEIAVPMPDTRRPTHHELYLVRWAG